MITTQACKNKAKHAHWLKTTGHLGLSWDSWTRRRGRGGLGLSSSIYPSFVHKVAVFQESQAQYTSTFQAPAFITFADVPLTTASPTDKPQVKVGGSYTKVWISGGVAPWEPLA